MIFIKKIFYRIQKLFSSNRVFLRKRHIFRVDPVSVVVLLSVFTVAWGISRGATTQISAHMIANMLRQFPESQSQLMYEKYQAGLISGYDLQVSRQRIDMLRSTFDQYADIIKKKGDETALNALLNGEIKVAFKLIAPGLSAAYSAGTLVGELCTGEGDDQILSSLFSANIKEKLWSFFNLFSEEQKALSNRIFAQLKEIEALGDDKLFRARMRVIVNYLHNDWSKRLKQNPCQTNLIMEELRKDYKDDIEFWANKPVRIVGKGEKWATNDEFFDWLISEARNLENKEVIKTWSGNFEFDRSPTGPCKVCVPPWLSGKINLSIHLDTCEVSGDISGGGEGEGAKSEGCAHGINNPCSGMGKLDLNGVIKGSVDGTGKITFEPTDVKVVANITWREGCDIAAGEYNNRIWDDTITLSGTTDWGEFIWGEIEYPYPGCGSNGTFTLLVQENPIK